VTLGTLILLDDLGWGGGLKERAGATWDGLELTADGREETTQKESNKSWAQWPHLLSQLLQEVRNRTLVQAALGKK
jgi:hypothetical protein